MIKIEELTDLLIEENKQEQFNVRFSDENVYEQMRQHAFRAETHEYPTRHRYNSIDAIKAINQLMSSLVLGSTHSLKIVYSQLRNMSHSGNYTIVSIDVERTYSYAAGSIITIRLVNGTTLIYDV